MSARTGVYVMLLHYPMVNRRGEVVTTAVTNLDLHDIARSARTYGCDAYYVVTPIEDQHALLNRILGHWAHPESAEGHPDRVSALGRIRLRHTFAEAKAEITALHGEPPEVVLTDARPHGKSSTYAELRAEFAQGRTRPLLIVFGTGWGTAPEFNQEVDRVLAPVYGPGGPGAYNHLSVRAAAAIVLDRLFGV